VTLSARALDIISVIVVLAWVEIMPEWVVIRVKRDSLTLRGIPFCVM